jgi:uncharacterized membrane protein YedE/YeeE
MTFPVQGHLLLLLAVPFGVVFGVLLHRGGVTHYNVIVNQFRFKDFTVLKVMFTAILVGAAGVLLLHGSGHAQWHVKPANMLGVVLGAGLFGAGMVLYGYCPGTGLAAAATGSLHALAGLIGMLAGGVLYGLSFPWIDRNIQSVGQLGKLRLPEITGHSDWAWLAALALVAAAVFAAVEIVEKRARNGAEKSPEPLGGAQRKPELP